MPVSPERLKEKTTWIFDMDGVIYNGKTPVEGAPELVARLEEEGKNVVFLTNNSTKTREMYVSTLREMGISTSVDRVFTSAVLTVSWLANHVNGMGKEPASTRVYVIGEAGLVGGLSNAGFTLVTGQELDEGTFKHGDVDFVVVGMDRGLTYKKLFHGLNCIISGAVFLFSNDDPNMPLGEGVLAPGTGCIVAALKTCSGAEPHPACPFGKPNKLVFDAIARSLGVGKDTMVMVGDRPETDILAARKAGIPSILVHSGITRSTDKIPGYMEPTTRIDSVADILAWFT